MKTNDLLLKWRDRVNQMKFALVQRIEDKLYQRAIEAEGILRKFFSTDDYTLTADGFSEHNYLVHLLSSDRPQDIRLVVDLAELIMYTEARVQRVKLKDEKKNVVHLSLSQKLFEGYTDKFLRERNIEPVNNKKYKKEDDNGNLVDKPVDNFFDFDGKGYIIECTRINEPINKSLLYLSTTLINNIAKDKIPDYKSFKGYIGIKVSQNLAAIVNRAREKVLDMYQAYMSRHDEITDNSPLFTHKLIDKFVCNEFDIEILPYYGSNLNNQDIFEHNDLYATFFSFYLEADHSDIRKCSLVINGRNDSLVKKINDKTIGKINKKIEQHQYAIDNYQYNLIVFVEIDVTKGHSPDTPMFAPIEAANVDKARIADLITDYVSIMLIYKEVTDKHIKRECNFLYRPQHQRLAHVVSDS